MQALKLWMETEGIKYSPSSLIGKAHEVNSREYLNDVIAKIPYMQKAYDNFFHMWFCYGIIKYCDAFMSIR